MDSLLELNSLEYGLVRCEVGELNVWTCLVEDLVELEVFEGDRAEGHVGFGWGGARGEGGGEAGAQSIGEESGHPLHGVADWRDHTVQLIEVLPCRHVVLLGHGFGAGEEKVHQLESTVLLLIRKKY